MQFFLLILGLAMIVKSSDVLIDSTSKIAGHFGVSTFVIGITVIAFGTSAPELAIGIFSGISHTNQLTLGNVIGASIANIALIVGISAIIMPLAVKDSVTRREIPLLIGIQLILTALLFFGGTISRIDSVILLTGFTAFMIYVIKSSKQSIHIRFDEQGDIDTDGDRDHLPQETTETYENKTMLKLYLFSALSLAGLFVGGRITVNSSSRIAQDFGLSETLIGLTVVSLATTMPELITGIMAAIKKEPDIVLGNCIGSNIFNILPVLGLSSLISPISVEGTLFIDIIIMIVLTAFVLYVSRKHKTIGRSAGIVLLSTYIGYIGYKVISVIL